MRVTQMSTHTSGRAAATNPEKPAYSNVQPTSVYGKSNIGKILSHFEKDDYILLGIIAVLVWEGCDDYILLAALGYLFFMGVKINDW